MAGKTLRGRRQRRQPTGGEKNLPGHIAPVHRGRQVQQQAHALRVGDEDEGQHKGRQGVFPGHQRGAVRPGAGDGGRREGAERGGRRNLAQHRIIEDEHMRGVIRHAQLHQRGCRHHGTNDVAGGDRHGEAHNPDDQRRIDCGDHQRATRRLNGDVRKFQPQARQRDHAHNNARAGAGGGNADGLVGAIGQCLDQLARPKRMLLRQEGERHCEAHGVEHRQRRGITQPHEEDDRDEAGEMVPATPEHGAHRLHHHRRRLAVIGAAADAALVQFHHEEQAGIVEAGRHRGHQQHAEI